MNDQTDAPIAGEKLLDETAAEESLPQSAEPAAPRAPLSLSMLTHPDKWVYLRGDALDVSGMEVVVCYDDGDTLVLGAGACSTMPAANTELRHSGTRRVAVFCEIDGVQLSTSFSVRVL